MPADITTELAAFKAALLEMAVGDLIDRKSCTFRETTRKEIAIVNDKRKAVLRAAANLTNEQFTAALMAANFLGS